MGVGCDDLLPDHRAHVVEPDGLAKFDDLRPDGNDLVPAVVDRAGKLVADVDAETAAGMQHPLAFVPDKVQVVDVALVTFVKADLVLRPVVLELPVGWRGDNKMHRPVSEEVHLSAVAVDYGVMALQGAVGCMGFLVGGEVSDA